MEITVYREPALAREVRRLPAATYNLARGLLTRGPGTLFIPIRSMQFLAIVDAEEIVFVDQLRKNWAEIAWQRFLPQTRSALDEPVPYEAVYYRPDGAALMLQLQAEFAKALTALAAKGRRSRPGDVLRFERPDGK